MISTHRKPASQSRDSAIIERLMEATFVTWGNKQSRPYLRNLATLLVTPPTNVVGIKSSEAKTEADLEADMWLQERLPTWLSRHG